MRVALGVSGGIAAYKACEIIRGLDGAGVEVHVLMTRNACQFVTPLTLQTLAGRKVQVETFDTDSDQTVHHIELARTIDLFAVAPATANVLAKFSGGIADDLLSTFFISLTVPTLVAPAMNSRMWLHDATRRNLATLANRGVEVIEPESGWLAEREVGVGRLADPAVIVERILAGLRRSSELTGKRVVVSAGPTREPIDPVRFISNGSSGRMGFALATVAAQRGADVTLVSGPVSLPTPFGVRRVDVKTSAEMRDAVLSARDDAAIVFMSAAVSDFIPTAEPRKIKKSGDGLTLKMERGPDILAEMGRDRREDLLVGFAAETDDLLQNAQDKLERKNLDMIVANDVSTEGIGINSPDNAVTMIDRDGTHHDVGKRSKRLVAEAILDHATATLKRRAGATR
ncbi:MAG: bifunctional phosphopantothenoylcysteine decarboxylase/phosphopantothenate--cysteine ligase CoaBC [Acidobacteriota bacterium]|nr:bifunctional phosphopantothenoylcysteine decarboxylase/phosphopantothenate--cysteine ligase CoaBC [Acidobacteriota bacterium]MDH3785027.1 bifunctional phosphopantothenoylcysteine decarboxylase/phosphopantothenate--cysteine ligase CoaBC [Acidobacteriota bacterium]